MSRRTTFQCTPQKHEIAQREASGKRAYDSTLIQATELKIPCFEAAFWLAEAG